MNIISVIGLIGALGGFSLAMAIEYLGGTDVTLCRSYSSMCIVFIGVFGATLLKSSAADIAAAVSLGGRAFKNPAFPIKLIDQLVEFADIARKN